MTPISKDDANMNDEPQITVKPASRGKLKPKKPLMLRDLVKTQVQKGGQLNTLELKKQKLTEGDNQCILMPV